jgi:ribose/xylose/arabinose/galactoside ABC-type transport system permease subunit
MSPPDQLLATSDHPEKAVPRRTVQLPREIGILGALALMLLVLAIFIPQFRDIQNITNITRNFSFVGTTSAVTVSAKR